MFSEKNRKTADNVRPRPQLRFDPDPSEGLSSAQVARRVSEGFVNTAVKAESKSVSEIIRDNLSGGTVNTVPPSLFFNMVVFV